MRSFKVIGLGGIGSYLIEPLCRYLESGSNDNEVVLIDGDEYETKNRTRQRFHRQGNKAEVTVEFLREIFPNLCFRTKREYVTKENVIVNLRDKDLIFLCVDNHATRKLVSERCEKLDNITLISGGNDFTDGNVFVYTRKYGRDGKKYNRPMTTISAKIANPTDENPAEAQAKKAGCDVLVREVPQLIFTNLAIASAMLNCYYALEQGKVDFEQVCIDILTLASRSKPEERLYI